jgi:FkbM family methyltransferase
VDERDLIGARVFTTGGYEAEVWGALASLAVRDEVLWDVGANIGTVSIPALHDARFAHVHAFEPDPETSAVLHHNLALNGRRYTVHPLALGDRTGTVGLRPGPTANRGLSSVASSADPELRPVACRTADDLVFGGGVPAPTLMKIDVEGWELPVLRGARRLMAEVPPKALVVEAICAPDGTMTEPALARVLSDSGYDVRRLPRPDGTIEERENFFATRRVGPATR